MRLRDKIIGHIVHGLALPLIRPLVKKDVLPFPAATYAVYPEGSLGKDLYDFLCRHNYSLIPHFETHDVKHVLLGYGVTGKDEGCMQFFYIGNRHYSPATIMTAISSIFLLPESLGAFCKAFQRGRKALPVGKLKLAEMLLCQTAELRTRFSISFDDLKKQQP